MHFVIKDLEICKSAKIKIYVHSGLCVLKMVSSYFIVKLACESLSDWYRGSLLFFFNFLFYIGV